MGTSGISPSFPGLFQSSGQVPHVLLTRSPLTHVTRRSSAFDLHVLGPPPAFVLSQDQTLRQNLRWVRRSDPTVEISGAAPPKGGRRREFLGRPEHQSRPTRHRSKATDRSRPPLSVSALNCSGSVRQRLAIVGGRPALAFSSSIPFSRSSRRPHDHPAHEPPKGIGGALITALCVRSEYTNRHQGRPLMLGVPDPRVKPSQAGQRYRPGTHAPTDHPNLDRNPVAHSTTSR